MANLDRLFGKGIQPQFPIFTSNASKGASLHYLDSAASSQKPEVVIERLNRYLSFEHANINRGAYSLSAQATDNYENARATVAELLGAKQPDSIIFTRGTTESINLVSHAFENYFSQGDSILITLLEHHSNIVPWQLLAHRRKLNLVFAEISDHGELDLQDFVQKLRRFRPKLVSIAHTSNALGTVLPIAEAIAEAKKVNCRVVVDAAQAVAHTKLDVESLGCDFLAFSGHKMYGPTGIGVLYVRPDLYPKMEPFQGGGGMIQSVAIEGSTWAEAPQKFEAGTPAIGEAIALGAAVEFLRNLDLAAIEEYESALFHRAFEMLSSQVGVEVYGPAVKQGKQSSILSFNIKGIHPHDLSTVADTLNVYIRAGHHCAMPALKRLGVHSTARASL
ncbi:MAG: cysteine desulfurase CsdA, partial [Proteobacteria bacterium]